MRLTTNPNLAGVLLAAGAAVGFSINDLGVKFLSGKYALHQVMLIRSLIGLICLLIFAAMVRDGFAALRPKRMGMQFARSVVIVTSNICYFTGLAVMPFADAAAVAFVAPLILTVLSIVFLGEKVGPRRWLAIIFGFVGVVVMLRPGAGVIQPAALLVLISAALYSVSYLMTRMMRDSEGPLSMSIWMQVTFILVSGSVGIFFGDGHLAENESIFAFLLRAWIWPSAEDWLWLTMIGVTTTIAGVMITQAFRIAEAGLVAPMEYVGMPLAILWGMLIFGTWPDATSWAGIALICGSGLYIIWRETVVQRKDRR